MENSDGHICSEASRAVNHWALHLQLPELFDSRELGLVSHTGLAPASH